MEGKLFCLMHDPESSLKQWDGCNSGISGAHQRRFGNSWSVCGVGKVFLRGVEVSGGGRAALAFGDGFHYFQ